MIDKEYSNSTWYDSRLKIRPSKIHGEGMFATLPIEKDEILAVIGGEVLTEKDFKSYIATVSKYNAIQIGEDKHLVDISTPVELMNGSMNHSCDSNTWMKDEVTLIARRDIAQDEEITVDYALFTTDSDWILKECQCESVFCRHNVSGNDWKILSVQKQYRNHFSPFINERIRKYEY